MNCLIRTIFTVFFAFVAMTANANVALAQNTAIIRVDIVNGDPDPPNFGQNGWGSDAYRFLQDALEAATTLLGEPHDFDTVHIWVAQGTYRPDQRASNGPNAQCPPYGDCVQSHSFNVPSGVSLTIRGGFEGTESNPGERPSDTSRFPTILSGDLECASHANNGRAIIKIDAGPVTFEGLTIRGVVQIGGSAAARFLDCTFDARENAPLRFRGETFAEFRRCAFAARPAAGGDDGRFFSVDLMLLTGDGLRIVRDGELVAACDGLGSLIHRRKAAKDDKEEAQR